MEEADLEENLGYYEKKGLLDSTSSEDEDDGFMEFEGASGNKKRKLEQQPQNGAYK